MEVMEPENCQSVPPLLPPVLASARPQRALTLYAIIAFKLLKGALLLLAAFVVYNMAGLDLQQELAQMIQQANLDLESKMFNEVAQWLNSITEANVRMFATGTVLYSIFSFVEGIGLIFRASWAGWMAIGESAFFVPIELYQFLRRPSVTLAIILIVNIVIVWYLYAYRHRLFKHHHH
ncbi:MAG TPA: DUF2127 domain-containing protein [Verrucomicrobiae bacterium]|jgi:uncharacterized membrane protein (DUF2068 family)|nr:DUF2127 domain-containing protein [Verrucomicrobiae bacterium]